MRKPGAIRNRSINIRLNQEEYERIEKRYKLSACRDISGYCRAVLQCKPVHFNCRDQSKDEILNVLIQLKRELSDIGHTYDQMVAQLDTLRTVPELKAWMLLSRNPEREVLEKIDEIKWMLIKLGQIWYPAFPRQDKSGNP